MADIVDTFQKGQRDFCWLIVCDFYSCSEHKRLGCHEKAKSPYSQIRVQYIEMYSNDMPES